MSAAIEQRNQDATCYIGGLAEEVTEELLWELMLQAGPVVSVYLPKDKVTGLHQGFGFVEFRGEEDADYAIKIMNNVALFGRPLRVNKASSGEDRTADVGANLFVGGLAPAVDERLLFEAFSGFGTLIDYPVLMRDPDSGASRGFGFVKYDTFEAADVAIESMNGQFLSNRKIVVQFAFKETSKGERHGSEAERKLAAARPRPAGRQPPFAPPAAPAAVPPPFPPGAAVPPPLPPSFAAGGGGMGGPRPPPGPPPMALMAAMGVARPPPPMMGAMPPVMPPAMPPPPPMMAVRPPPMPPAPPAAPPS